MMDIYNYWRYDGRLSSSGMPTVEQMKAVADAGVEVVINLATSKSEGAIPNEGELVSSLGMEYIHIPVEWSDPTRQNLEAFFDAMDMHKERKVLVHCQANYRASSFVMLYRVHRLGWKKEDALPVMEKVWDPKEFPIWQIFIEANLPPE